MLAPVFHPAPLKDQLEFCCHGWSLKTCPLRCPAGYYAHEGVWQRSAVHTDPQISPDGHECSRDRGWVTFAGFAGSVKGSRWCVFSKELEWFQTVNVFIFVAKSAHLNNFVGLEGSPSSGQAGNCTFAGAFWWLCPAPLCIVGDRLSSWDVFFSCHISVGRKRSDLELALSWYSDVQGQHTLLRQSMIFPLVPRDCFALTIQLHYCKKRK